ncbi:unnamed protein product [Closterium sp. NIES-54]
MWVASVSGAVPPPLFQGCNVPQLPTFTASLASDASDKTAAATTTAGQSKSRGGKKGRKGASSGGGGGGIGVGDEPSAITGGPPTVSGGGDVRGGPGPAGPPVGGFGVAAYYTAQRKQ